MPKTNVRPPTLGGALEAALAARRAALVGQTLDAYRLVNGPGDGAPAGLTIDRYADYLVVAAREGVDAELVEAWARAAAALTGARGVVLKRLLRPVKRSTSAPMFGEPPPPELCVREDDATFLCALDDGVSTGLFLDQREARRYVRPYARGAEVLNLFAYTCAFSVHAALAGARRVTSVDAARRALARGRENMRASGLDPDRHRWFPDDVATHLARAGRRGDRYGLVILDPPVFGHAGAKRHVLSQALEELVAGAVAVVEPGGVLALSVHALEVDHAALEALLERTGRPRETLAVLGLPGWDHPTVAEPSGADRGEYLKTLVVRLG